MRVRRGKLAESHRRTEENRHKKMSARRGKDVRDQKINKGKKVDGIE